MILTLVAVILCVVVPFLALIAWESEKERREQQEAETRTLRDNEAVLRDEINRLRAIEEAAYGMYCDVNTYGTLECVSPSVKAYERASQDHWRDSQDYWEEEVEDVAQPMVPPLKRTP